MLRIEREGERLVSQAKLQRKPLQQLYDLARLLANSPVALLEEIGEPALVLGTGSELGGADLLAIDPTGAVLIVAVQKPGEASALMRAINAAGRVASWPTDELLSLVSSALAGRGESLQEEQLAGLNRTQRVLLLAESFGEQTLVAADWLRGRGLDVKTVEAKLLADADLSVEYLELTPVSASEPAAAPEPSPTPDQEPPEKAPAPRPQPDEADRRTANRRIKVDAGSVRIEYAGRLMKARLVDLSDGGIGIEMDNPLPIGSKVNIEAEVEDGGETTRLTGRGHVAHCRFGEEAGFRTGVCFEDLDRVIEKTA